MASSAGGKKRSFRSEQLARDQAQYPAHAQLSERREFLKWLAGLAVGGGLAVQLAGCAEEREVTIDLSGVPDGTPAPRDSGPVVSDSLGVAPPDLNAPLDGGTSWGDALSGIPDAPPAPRDSEPVVSDSRGVASDLNAPPDGGSRADEDHPQR